MEIKIGNAKGTTDRLLLIKGNGTAFEDNIIEGWYQQILNHLQKLKIVDTAGENKNGK